MADDLLDVVGIGNAIVDVLSQADPGLLREQDLPLGTMNLIDDARADALYGLMGPGVEMSGGSAGNTMAGIASLGGAGAFIGKVHDDFLGRIFTHDLRAAGVEFTTAPLSEGPATARCLVFVTPDAQRTMATYLGACVELGPEDIDTSTIARAQVTYLEGYLWDPPRAKEAFRKAIALAHSAGRKVALSLSDPFCVDRYRDEFLQLLEGEVDIVFANEAEIMSLYRADSFDDALQKVRGHCEIAALTRSAHGSIVVSGDEVHVVDAAKAGEIVDTTGAGDLYAAGFLYGLAHGRDLRTCGEIASIAAAEIIGHFGARPEHRLADLITAVA